MVHVSAGWLPSMMRKYGILPSMKFELGETCNGPRIRSTRRTIRNNRPDHLFSGLAQPPILFGHIGSLIPTASSKGSSLLDIAPELMTLRRNNISPSFCVQQTFCSFSASFLSSARCSLLRRQSTFYVPRSFFSARLFASLFSHPEICPYLRLGQTNTHVHLCDQTIMFARRGKQQPISHQIWKPTQHGRD